MATNPREKLQKPYDDAAKAEAEAKRIGDLISGVGSVGKGAVTFSQIDKYLADNPDAKYFRIENGGNNVGKAARSYTNDFGTWSDNDAAIVGQDSDKGARDIFRYANISAATPRTGKRGEKATVGIQYSPSSFFKDNEIADYKSDYGMIYSRDEYGALKEKAASIGKSDKFLSAGAEKKPTFSSDYGKDKGAILTGEGESRRAKLSNDSTDSLANDEDPDNAAKRKLLG